MEDKEYRQIKHPINSSLIVVQDNNYKWGAIDEDGNVIIPFGKYAWIDGFQNGLAKVIGHNDNTSPNVVAVYDSDFNKTDKRIAEQGIINESGEEVLPLEYIVWKFYGKDFPTIKYFKGDEKYTATFEFLNPSLKDELLEVKDNFRRHSYSDNDDYDIGDVWDAMTDGQYGDMPEEGIDGDFDILGY